MGVPLNKGMRSVAALSALALAAAGCGLVQDIGERAADGSGQGAGGEASDSPSTDADGEFVREGYIGDAVLAWQEVRLEITELATIDGMTRMSATYTSLADEPLEGMGASTNPMNVQHYFRLYDTVGQTQYEPFKSNGTHFGEVRRENLWLPGVTYELVAYFPEIEEAPETLTVQGPGSIGEIAGVPLTEGEPLDNPEDMTEYSEADDAPPEGETVALPVNQSRPESDDEPIVNPMVSAVERVVGGRETEGDATMVALRSDVLFEFDESELTGDAEQILADVVEETRENADPEKPPIGVIGHTDGVGKDSYNQTLSEERAEAVRAHLEEELGSEYEYETEGRGATEPVENEGGDDDAEARAQNRRVEISYRFKEESLTVEEDDEETEEEELEVGPDQIAEPAAFRPNTDLEPAGELSFTQEYFHGGDRVHDWTLRVFPFYRDGAFLVARFEAELEDGTEMASRYPFSSMFSAVDPATGSTYRTINAHRDASEPTSDGGNIGWPGTPDVDTTQYGFFYLPAPQPDAETLDFVVADHGKVPDVPIEG